MAVVYASDFFRDAILNFGRLVFLERQLKQCDLTLQGF